MSRIPFFHHNLYRKVQYFEWALLVICLAGEALALRFAPPDPTAPNLPVSMLLVLVVVGLSFFAPVEGTYWDRLCFLFLELIVITGATAAGSARFVFPLFAVVMAKSCLLLDGRGQIFTAAVEFCAQIAWAGIKMSFAMPQLLAHGLTPLTVLTILGGSLLATYVGIVMMILVAMVTRSLVAEQKSRLETERLSKEVEALATEVERSRIAREIHDSLGHSLTTLNVQLDLARKFSIEDPARSAQALQLAKELATQSLDDVRLAVRSLRSPNFDLKDAVDRLVQDARRGQSLDVSVDGEMPDLPPAVGFQLFRVIQECLTNVVKHANASRVSIAVSRKGRTVEVDFSDNGSGLKEQPHHGFGIKGMQERVESLHGSMTIQAGPQQGTRIQVKIPL